MDPTVKTTTAPGVEYTEVGGQMARSLPVRHCQLHTLAGEPVAALEVLAFRLRFGAVAVAAEGIGGVETQPGFRRRGHIGTLLRQSLSGMAQRVDVACVSDGIEGLYEKFGCVTAVAEGQLHVRVGDVERATGGEFSTPDHGVREGSPADVAAMIDLYNTAHSGRPFTHERHPDWNRLTPQTTWRPGSRTLVLRDPPGLAGYAVLDGRAFGATPAPLTVVEFAAEDAIAARRLLRAVAEASWSLRLSEFKVREPVDSLVGQVARQMGCRWEQTYPPSGGMLAAILNRSRLVRALEAELRRRAAGHPSDETYAAAAGALRRGELIPDDTTLIRLLLGFWSTQDAVTAGTDIPAPYRDLCAAWFPGGGGRLLPYPYAHTLDRY